MKASAVLKESHISGKVLDHLGLVASTMSRLGIIEQLDERLPVSEAKGAKLSMGQRVGAMILNGLGFIDERLYLFSEFLSNKPVSRLLGKGVKASYFTDDALGRCLDAIHAYGPTRLFSELAFSIGASEGLLGKSVHIDSTTLSLYGNYPPSIEYRIVEGRPSEADLAAVKEGSTIIACVSVASESSVTVYYLSQDSEEVLQQVIESAELVISLRAGLDDWSEAQCSAKIAPLLSPDGLVPTPHLTYGHSKANRPDLKQVVINLATTGAAGFPLWMESHSGNASDKRILHAAAQRMRTFCQGLKAAPEFLYVADSAMYESCLKDDVDLVWLSRVPERIKAARTLLEQPDSAFNWSQKDDKGYRYAMQESQWGGVAQRWCIVSSEHAFARETKTLDKAIAKEVTALDKMAKRIQNKVFGCQDDAHIMLKSFDSSMKYHQKHVTFVPVEKYAKKGRPSAEDKKVLCGYNVVVTFTLDEDKITCARRKKGRFIIATNSLDTAALPDAQLLVEYKGQAKTESGFKFIKDDALELDSVFLKKPERIAALNMIMTLCLMVYSVAQHQLREALKAADDTLPDQKKKPTQIPTLKSIFKRFHGVQLITITFGEFMQKRVINLCDFCQKVIDHFGQEAQAIYSAPG
jgi:transposase